METYEDPPSDGVSNGGLFNGGLVNDGGVFNDGLFNDGGLLNRLREGLDVDWEFWDGYADAVSAEASANLDGESLIEAICHTLNTTFEPFCHTPISSHPDCHSPFFTHPFVAPSFEPFVTHPFVTHPVYHSPFCTPHLFVRSLVRTNQAHYRFVVRVDGGSVQDLLRRLQAISCDGHVGSEALVGALDAALRSALQTSWSTPRTDGTRATRRRTRASSSSCAAPAARPRPSLSAALVPRATHATALRP